MTTTSTPRTHMWAGKDADVPATLALAEELAIDEAISRSIVGIRAARIAAAPATPARTLADLEGRTDAALLRAKYYGGDLCAPTLTALGLNLAAERAACPVLDERAVELALIARMRRAAHRCGGELKVGSAERDGHTMTEWRVAGAETYRIGTFAETLLDWLDEVLR